MHRSIALLIACVLLLLTLAPGAAQPASPLNLDSFIRADRLGIAHISSIDTPQSEERYEHALSLGAGWNRWPLYWDRVETRPDRFDWSAYDALVESDLEYGLRLDVILLGSPAFHRDDEQIAGLQEAIFADQTDTPAPGKTINPDNPWAVFVQAAVSRYMPGGDLAQAVDWPRGQGVRVWEIWNEPDYATFWGGTVSEYARLLKVAYLVIHSVDPEATVMVGGLLYPTRGNFLAQVLSIFNDDPAPEDHNWYMDAVALHNYGDSWRSGWLTLVVRQTLIEYGLERPIWITETGVPIWDDYPGPMWTKDDPQSRELLATADQQAAFVVQSAAYAWAEGAQVIIYHQLYDDCGNQPPGTDFAPSANNLCRPGEICAGDVFGIYRNPDNAICFSRHPEPDTARPVASAYALLADVFGTASFSRRGIIDDVREDGAALVTFSRPATHERIVVIWNTLEEPLELSLPAEDEQATLFTVSGERQLTATDEAYTLRLPAAEMPRQRFLQSRVPVDIGGMPVILVEKVGSDDAWDRLAYETFESTERPANAATPVPASQMSEDRIDELTATSPTGVVFYSLEHARLRDLPGTEGTNVIATLRPRETVPVVGRLEDGSWLQVIYEGRPLWVAEFLGDVLGDLQTTPVIVFEEEAEPES
ncbi:MAG: hypothetical protein IT320_24930 [Anaerolineae bacterium]|nr:hypothetical protein [Anaerolineae bacterium]